MNFYVLFWIEWKRRHILIEISALFSLKEKDFYLFYIENTQIRLLESLCVYIYNSHQYPFTLFMVDELFSSFEEPVVWAKNWSFRLKKWERPSCYSYASEKLDGQSFYCSKVWWWWWWGDWEEFCINGGIVASIFTFERIFAWKVSNFFFRKW